MSDSELAVALTTAGLHAEGLAAAGVSAEMIPGLVDSARQHLSSSIATWRSAQESVASANTEVDRLTSLIQAGTATPEDIAELEPARDTLEQAKLDRANQQAEFYEHTTSSLQVPTKALLQAVRSGRGTGWDLPTAYLAGTHEEPQWAELRDALSHVRIAEKLNQSPEPHALQTLAEAKADPNVAAANTNLNANLPSVTAAWDLAVFSK